MRMIEVPVSTIDKPLTPIDFIAKLAECRTQREVGEFSEKCPINIRNDERFTRAVATRIAELKGSSMRRKSA